jgi:isocitrate dehydrogenase
MSEIVANGFGSRNNMYNHLVGAKGEHVFETNHGTIPRHYQEWKTTNKAYSNPIATIYTWTEALRHLSHNGKNHDLHAFCDQMQKAVHMAIKNNVVTRDIAIVNNRDIAVTAGKDYVTMEEFVAEVKKNFR